MVIDTQAQSQTASVPPPAFSLAKHTHYEVAQRITGVHSQLHLLTSPSYLVRNRTLGPPLENNPEISPVIER